MDLGHHVLTYSIMKTTIIVFGLAFVALKVVPIHISYYSINF